jgi:DNA-binding SARP family transcriptional activator
VARLLLGPNTFVTIGALAEALWDGVPPDSAERQVQNAASRVRHAWRRVGVPAANEIIETARTGYRLIVDPDRLDIAPGSAHSSAGRRVNGRAASSARPPNDSDSFRSASVFWS